MLDCCVGLLLHEIVSVSTWPSHDAISAVQVVFGPSSIFSMSPCERCNENHDCIVRLGYIYHAVGFRDESLNTVTRKAVILDLLSSVEQNAARCLALAMVALHMIKVCEPYGRRYT
jgi:hypothetical protein